MSRQRNWSTPAGMMLILGLSLATSASLATAATTAPSAPIVRKEPYAQYLHDHVAAVLAKLNDDHDFAAAQGSLQSLFDQAILYSPAQRLDCIRETDFALRLVSQLGRVPEEKRATLLSFLLAHENLAHTLVFLIRDDEKGTAGAYELLDRLREKREPQLDTYHNLAAAICVVHNRSLTDHINENQATAADPIDIFDYYVRNESKMFYGLQNVPAELLVHVVDTTASIPDMEWALNKYAGRSDVGSLYFEVNYDYEALKTGNKTLTSKGFNLPNILQYGGVCIDQAYFSSTVGKAIGIPTAIDIGESGEAAHAWLGFLQYNGQSGAWNFDTGRYDGFQNVRGSVRDPQARQDVPDCYVTLLSELIGTRAVDRQNAVALTDAAGRVGTLMQDKSPVDAPPADAITPGSCAARPRPVGVAAQLDFIESALRSSVAYTPAWFLVRDLAVANKLTLDQKRKWSDVLIRLGAAKYPDFTVSILMPMVKSVQDADDQNTLLASLGNLFQARADLSASILMAQAELFEAHDQPSRAGECYMAVINRYADSGPFVIRALRQAEALLKKTNNAGNIVLVYQQAWSQTSKPGDWAPQFIAESNWYRIGQIYAKHLADGGDSAKAAEVRAQLDAKSPTAGGQ
jgi:hypothetical protein